MTMLRMNAVADVIPEARPSLFQLSDRYAMSRAELMVFHRIYGLDQVPVWHASIGELLEEVLTRLLKRPGVTPGRVRWIVHAHTGAQQNVAGQAALTRVCERLGLVRAQPFGMTANNCASTISAMRVVDRLLARGERGDQAIVVTADVAFTPILQVIPNSSVTGDAAVACLFSRDSDGHRILSARLDIYGQHAACQWQEEAANAEFETEYPERVALTMARAVAEAGLSWDDIRLVLPHNVNIFSWRRVAARAGIPMELVYLDQVGRTAHCFGSDIFLNFVMAEQEGRFTRGDKLLLVTVGLGAVFAAAVIEYGSTR